MKIRMIKSLCPELIPHGAIGFVADKTNIEEPGLHAASFYGFYVLVYPDEVEKIQPAGELDP